MTLLWILLGVTAGLAGLVLLTAYISFRITFYSRRKPAEEFAIPRGKIYEPYRDTMVNWMKETRSFACEEVSITSFDGLTLRGKYYECRPGAPIELMFHGYRGSAERDLCGGVQRCFALGRSALVVDQRACGRSEGRVITFGINESRDCLRWVDFMIEHFGKDVRIILTGISMGAATVLMAGGMDLPENVVGILADCGYTSAREIIHKVIRQINLPDRLLYPFVRLGARLYGRFDLEELSPLEAVQRCRVPVIFFHGESDDFVPCEMSRENFAACAAPKRLLTVPEAGHGLCYLVDGEGYLTALREFFGEK
ncbi:MAG: alpha/beta hydrolase [Oscillospiraceae bacterium]|nr:alpha/beta hydrolase [Oscillospiraceae bacterium]